MLERILRNRRWPIGLDIGTDSIKMLQLQNTGHGVSAAACGLHRFPAGTPESGPERRKAVVSGIGAVLRDGGFRQKRVVTAISSTALQIKNLRVGQMPPQKMTRAILDEARERFSFELGPDQFRYIEAGQVRQGTEVRQEIIMLAVPREVIEDHLAVLAEVGLVPECIEAEPVALFRVFQHFLRRRADEQQVTVIADIGRSATRLIVARGAEIVFIKRIDIGGAALTEAVGKQLNLTYDEAQDLRSRMIAQSPCGERRRDAGKHSENSRNSVDWTVYDAMRGKVEELAKEISLCLRYCSVTFRGLRPDTILLTGGEAHDSALVDLLDGNLGVKCVVGAPLRGVDVVGMERHANRRGTLAEWGVCAGLALSMAQLERIGDESDHGENKLSA